MSYVFSMIFYVCIVISDHYLMNYLWFPLELYIIYRRIWVDMGGLIWMALGVSGWIWWIWVALVGSWWFWWFWVDPGGFGSIWGDLCGSGWLFVVLGGSGWTWVDVG
jgi:hypothetical protein